MSNRFIDANSLLKAITPIEFYYPLLEQRPVTLVEEGWHKAKRCPFSYDCEPSRFHVNLTNGAFKCHGCGVGGANIIAFTMKLNRLNFRQALQKLADDFGGEI